MFTNDSVMTTLINYLN